MFGFAVIIILILNRIIPTGFIPEEDQGYFKVELELPEGATLERTRVVTNRAVEWLKAQPGIEYIQNVTGSSPRVGSNQARAELTVILKPWEEREDENITLEELMDATYKEFETYPECKVFLSKPPVIPGLGSTGGFEMQLEAKGDASYDDLVNASDTLLYYASKHPGISGISSSLQVPVT